MTVSISRRGVIGTHQLVLFLFAVVVACMISGYKGIANYIAFGAMLTLITIWVMNNNGRISGTKELGLVVWFILYYIVTSFFNLDVKYFATYLSYNLLVFFPVIMCLMLEKSQDIGFMRSCVKTALVLWFVLAGYTTAFYLANPQAARLAASHQEFENTVMGGYHFAYGSSLLGVYLFSLLFDKRIQKKATKIWMFLGIALLAMVTYLTESALTTFSLILGVVMVLLFDQNRDNNKSSVRKVAMIVVLMVLVFAGYFAVANNVEKIAAWLAQRSDTLFFRRLGEIVDATFFDQETGHYTKRVGLIEQSWFAFLSNPIFGIGYQFGNVFSASKTASIGNHSEIMDLLARYGIVGAAPVFALYYRAFKKNRGSHVGVLAAFALMVFCNPFMSFHSHLVLFTIIPAMETILAKKAEIPDESEQSAQNPTIYRVIR